MLRIKTADALLLLDEITERMRRGEFETWELDDNDNFVHIGDGQWIGEGWLEAKVTNDGYLDIRFQKQELTKPFEAVVSVLQGRFIELLGSHFLGLFEWATFYPVKPHKRR